MDRIVITGATGFLGSNTARVFLEQGAEVFALVRPGSRHLSNLPQHENLHIVRCALEQVKDCVEMIGQADGFLHFAWGGVNRTEIDSPQVQNSNVEASLECIRAAGQLKCQVFMDAGSRVEYGTPDAVMEEDLECRPVNQYGKAKWEFCQQAFPLCESQGLKYFHLRFFSVYGPGDHPWSIISTLCRELPRGKPVSLSACRHFWNFMYIEDAAQAVYQLYRHQGDNPSGIVNVAGEDTRPLREFVEEIHGLAGGQGQLEYGTFVQAKEGALSVRPDIGRLKAFTRGDWKEEFSFRQGILETMEREEAE